MLKIVGGDWRGRRITAPEGRSTRPTSERVREAIFNVLAHRIDLAEVEVFDLFAGSGALGIEALSRGARHATFVEADARTAAIIRGNLKRLGAAEGMWKVSATRVESYLARADHWPEHPLILLDPPYGTDALERALVQIAEADAIPPGSTIVAESAARESLQFPGCLELFQAKRYGDTMVTYLTKLAAVPAAAPASERDIPGM